MNKPNVFSLILCWDCSFSASHYSIAFQLFSLERVGSLAGSLFGWLGCWLWALYLNSTQHRRPLKVAAIFLVVAFFGTKTTHGCCGILRSFHPISLDRRKAIRVAEGPGSKALGPLAGNFELLGMRLRLF